MTDGMPLVRHVHRVVTPEQYALGYRRWHRGLVDDQGRVRPQTYPFVKVRDLPNGDVLVQDPTP